MNYLLLIMNCVLLVSCATGNVKQPKKFSSGAVEFTVEESYQRVYSNLLDKMHVCKGKVWPGESASYRIKNGLTNEDEKGYITFVMNNAGSQRYYMHTVITQTSGKKTKAKAYIYNYTQEDYLPLIKRWAFEGGTDCGLSEQSNA
jgi:hypothetical protein